MTTARVIRTWGNRVSFIILYYYLFILIIYLLIIVFISAISGGQFLSLGSTCLIVGIVEHELMHAIGFLHEQVR